MAADVCTVIIVIRISLEAVIGLLGADVPFGLMIVMMCRSYHSELEGIGIDMVHVWFEPLALFLEIIGFEGGEIASDLRIQIGLAFQGGNDGFRGVEMLLNLVELVHGIHLHASDGFGNFLGGDIRYPDIAGVCLCL